MIKWSHSLNKNVIMRLGAGTNRTYSIKKGVTQWTVLVRALMRGVGTREARAAWPKTRVFVSCRVVPNIVALFNARPILNPHEGRAETRVDANLVKLLNHLEYTQPKITIHRLFRSRMNPKTFLNHLSSTWEAQCYCSVTHLCFRPCLGSWVGFRLCASLLCTTAA